MNGELDNKAGFAFDAKRWAQIRDRRGKFTIVENLLHNVPDQIAAMLRNVIVVRCEMHYWDSTGARFEYVALSPLFDLIGVGDLTPTYVCVIQPDGVQWERLAP